MAVIGLRASYYIMASPSVPVQCMFSSAALVANDKRCNSKPNKLEHILFVHDNFDSTIDSLLTAHCAQLVGTVEHYLETAKLNSRSSFS